MSSWANNFMVKLLWPLDFSCKTVSITFQPSQAYNEALHMQFSLLRVSSLRFLSTLICSNAYTELLVLPKCGVQNGECDDLRQVLKSIMKSMTQRAVMMNPISELILRTAMEGCIRLLALKSRAAGYLINFLFIFMRL